MKAAPAKIFLTAVLGFAILAICSASGADDASKTSTVVGTLKIVQTPATADHPARTIRIWLPPGYEAGGYYPVLYLQDGQNCFDRATSAFGNEWQVDETLTRLIADHRVPPMIVAGIDNGGHDRIKEYTFVADPKEGGGGGAAYADWLLHTVKPFVEKSYRIKTGPANTYIGGSSLGALISLEIALRNPGVFGGVIAMSPSLWWDDQAIVKEIEKDSAGLAGTRVWLDIGTRELAPQPASETMNPENRRMVDQARRLDAALSGHSIEHQFTIDEGARHNEIAWAKRFPDAIQYLTKP